jgi:uncharacterized protein YfaS (alpha-2-macroglobulin family)
MRETLFFLLLLLVGGALWYLFSDRPEPEAGGPAAALQRNDAAKQEQARKALEAAQSGAGGPARLFLRAETLAQQLDKDAWTVSFSLSPDEEKCAANAGGVQQCRNMLQKLSPKPENLKMEPKIPGAWHTEKTPGSVSLVFSAVPADLPDAAKTKKLKLTLPSFGENVEIAPGFLEAELPQWKLDIALPGVFTDPEDPSRLLVQAELKSSLPLKRESVEKRLHFTVDGDGADLGPPVIRRGDDYACSATLVVRRLPAKDGNLVVRLDKGVERLKGNGTLASELRWGMVLPGRDSFTSVGRVDLSTLIDDDATARPTAVVTFSCPVDARAAVGSVSARLLPLHRTEEERRQGRECDWRNLDSIPAEILARSPPVELTPQGKAEGFAELFAFSYTAPSGRFLYIEGTGGITGQAGYIMPKGWAAVRRVPEVRTELRFMQDGHILALGGARKLALEARGLDVVNWRIMQVRPDYLNLLANHSDSFAEPAVIGDSLSMDEISEAAEGKIPLAGGDGLNPQYAFLDLDTLMREGRRGIFQINLEGFKGGEARESAGRFLLLTDLGMVIKKGRKGERSVFVSSLSGGDPAAGAEVRVIARNGVSLQAVLTDAGGRADLPPLDGFVREKAPTAIEVRLGNDMTYMLMEDEGSRIRTGLTDRQGGADGLRVFAFSERGIYRPGETLHFGIIAANADWNPAAVEGLPFDARLFDPAGRERERRIVRLGPEGIGALAFASSENDPTGRWRLRIESDKRQMADAAVQLEDFRPDRIRVRSRFIEAEAPAGDAARDAPLSAYEDLQIETRVENLYGAPSVNSLVRASFRAHRVEHDFIRYEDYSFSSPAPAGSSRFEEGGLGEKFTDEKGEARFALPLRRLEQATYAVTVSAEGFESGGGRSVLARIVTLVSPFSRFIGTRSSADLNFLAKDSSASVDFIAVDRAGRPADSGPLNLKILATDYSDVLVRSGSGAYRYERRRRTETVRTEKLDIPAGGASLELPTGQTGDFELRIEDEAGALRAALSFTVAGGADRRQGLKRDAVLRARLDKESYPPGAEIKVFISAPYAGTGLITVENSGVRAHAWFKAETTDSVQKITLPEGVEGRGYLMVHLLRDIGFNAVHSEPAVNAALPFLADMGRRDMELRLETPEKTVPGEKLEIRVSASKSGKALVFAVDEGILQLTAFNTPSPLTFFLRDKPLEVEGMQNWNLLMPEYGLVQKEPAVGGDLGRDALNRLNPFRRKGEASVVFWSGLMDVGPEPVTLSWEVPAYFNGNLRVMAVSAGEDGIGESETRLLARAPVIITPTLPAAVAPGDEFDVTVALALAPGLVPDRGKAVPVTLEVLTDEGMIMEGEAERSVLPDKRGEERISFRLKAADRLGESVIRLAVSAGEGESRITARRPVSLSVRPAVPRISSFAAGRLNADAVTIPVARDMYPQFASVEAGLSGLPLVLAEGPARFLTAFPHGCTEQILSAAFPYALMYKHKELLPADADGEKAAQAVAKAVRTLRERQIRAGSFALWPRQKDDNAFLSVYALDFLLTAGEAGFSIPRELVAACAAETRALLFDLPKDIHEARMAAYAALTHTRAAGKGIGERFHDVSRLVKHCDTTLPGWRKDVSAALMAGTWSLMQGSREAGDLIKDVVPADAGDISFRSGGGFIGPLWADGLFMSVLAEHFPDKLQSGTGRALLISLVNSVAGGRCSTTGAVQAIRGIVACASGTVKAAGEGGRGEASILARDGGHRFLPLQSTGMEVKRLRGDAGTAEFVFSGGKGLYWQISSEGFDRVLPPASAGGKLDVKADYVLADGRPLTELKQGDDVLVIVRAKSLSGEKTDNVAVTSLLPGGFETVVSRAGEIEDAGDAQGLDAALALAGIKNAAPMAVTYAERREDRMLIYAALDGQERAFVYRIKAVNKGRFALPVTYAEALYDPDARAHTATGVLEVR